MKCMNCLYFRTDYDCLKTRFVEENHIVGGSNVSYAKCAYKNHDGMCKDYIVQRKSGLWRLWVWLTA